MYNADVLTNIILTIDENDYDDMIVRMIMVIVNVFFFRILPFHWSWKELMGDGEKKLRRKVIDCIQ